MDEQPLKPLPLLKQTFQAFSEDKAPRLGAALAYYSAFSLAPLLIIAIAVAGFIFGPRAAEGEIVAQFRSLLGETGAQLVQTMIAEAYDPARGLLASIIGVASLLLGATGAFNQLQQAMNEIWDVPPQATEGFKNTIMDRLLSLTMVLGTGFLLLTSLLLSAAVNGLGRTLSNVLGPGAESLILVLNALVTLGLTTLIFAAMFKYLPDRRPRAPWRDLLFGAGLTAVLFMVGKFLIGLYLGNASIGSAYGAAGSLAILLVWLYYSAQVFFLGAEFTKVYTEAKGSSGEPQPQQGAAGVNQSSADFIPDQGSGSLPAPTGEAGQATYGRKMKSKYQRGQASLAVVLLSSALLASILVIVGRLLAGFGDD